MSRWLIEKAGVKITVRCKGGAAKSLLEPMLQDLAALPVKKSSGVRLMVEAHEEGWRMRDKSSDIERKLRHAGDLIYHLSDRIVFHIADKASNVHCLHAAAVAVDGRALVIPAMSGSGKSSFTAWLVANSFDYLSDELILLSQCSVAGISRPIQIKPHGAEAMAPLLLEGRKMIHGKLANALMPESLGGKICRAASPSLSMIIFPQYTKDSQFSFNRIPSAEAGMKLMANHVNARNLDGHGFREMMEIIRNTACYQLEYGGFDQLPADFEHQLKTILADTSR